VAQDRGNTRGLVNAEKLLSNCITGSVLNSISTIELVSYVCMLSM
jgi:hypothetical protein